ncbi:hypothetical protein ACWCWD_06430 [Streptomyces sp. NPDC001493]
MDNRTHSTTTLARALTGPTHAQQILVATANALQATCDPFEPISLADVNATFFGAARGTMAAHPDVVTLAAIEAAAHALPTIHDGETGDAYSLRVHHAAKAA